MKFVTQFSSMLALAFLLVACGSDEGAGQTSTSAADTEIMDQGVESVVDEAEAVVIDVLESAEDSVRDAVSEVQEEAVSAVQDAAEDIVNQTIESSADVLTDAIDDPDEALKKLSTD